MQTISPYSLLYSRSVDGGGDFRWICYPNHRLLAHGAEKTLLDIFGYWSSRLKERLPLFGALVFGDMYVVFAFKVTDYPPPGGRFYALEGIAGDMYTWHALTKYALSRFDETKTDISLGIYDYVFKHQKEKGELVDALDTARIEFTRVKSDRGIGSAIEAPPENIKTERIVFDRSGVEDLVDKIQGWDKPYPPQFIFCASEDMTKKYKGKVDFIAPFSGSWELTDTEDKDKSASREIEFRQGKPRKLIHAVVTASLIIAITSLVISVMPLLIRPAPTPVPTPTPMPAVTATPMSAVTATPVPTPTPMPAVTATPMSAATATPMPAVTATPMSAVTATPMSAATATPMPAVTATPMPAVTATPMSAATATPMPAVTATPMPAVTPTPHPLLPLKSEPSLYTVGFVENAIIRYNANGRSETMDYYNTMESVDDQWYLFITDENNIIIAYTIDPGKLGTTLTLATGTVGNTSKIDIALMNAATETGGRFDYMDVNPETGMEELKHAYIIRHDGLLFGSGWYESSRP